MQERLLPAAWLYEVLEEGRLRAREDPSPLAINGLATRLRLLDPQVAQQPVERLLVGVVLLPADVVYGKSSGIPSTTAAATTAMA